MKKINIVLIAYVVFGLVGLTTSSAAPASQTSQSIEGVMVALRADNMSVDSHIPPPVTFSQVGTQNTTFNVTYVGPWNTAARNAFQYAINIWASQVNSTVPIEIVAEWTPLDPDFLGFGGPNNLLINFPGAPIADTWYPVAQANKLAGTDLILNNPDITISINSDLNWYLNTDGNTPANQFDLVTVGLQVLSFGLGFFGSMDVSNGQGSWGYGSGAPFIFDRFVINGSKQSLINTSLYPNFSSILAAQLTSNNVFFNGTNARIANGGSNPKLYAPSTWQPGLSINHLDEDTYPPGNPNSLMTPFLSPGEAIHDPAPVTRGIFQDIGWTTKPGKTQIVFVHGWQRTDDGTLECSPNPDEAREDIVRYLGPSTKSYAIDYWGDMPQWFLDTGDYDVWVAKFTTGNQGTPSLESNALCLREQIKYVASQNIGSKKIILVSHSTGGLVSRACLKFPDCANKVRTLITLGTPHAGVAVSNLILTTPLLPFCLKHPAVCQMSVPLMKNFNRRQFTLPTVDYYFIGGSGNPGIQGILWQILGENDGLVGKYSAVGWVYPNERFIPSGWAGPTLRKQLWTDEVHSRSYSFVYVGEIGTQVRNDYYHPRINFDELGQKSRSYQCITAILNPNDKDADPDKCDDATEVTEASTILAIPGLSQTTETMRGHISSGQSSILTLQIDTNDASLFYLSWDTGTLDFTLTRPDGQVIDPAYVAAHPDEVTYEFNPGSPDIPPFAGYYFAKNTLPGQWQLNATANNVGSNGADYLAFAALETNRSLSVTTNSDNYAAGQTAILTATLQNGSLGLTGATVVATLTRPDSVIDTVSLTDQGNGTYIGTYIIPNIPGFLPIAITASGTDGNTPFSRQVELLVTIASHNAQFTGNYSDHPRDDFGDSRYEYLDFLVEINASSPGDYILTADLVTNGQLVAQTAKDASLTTGSQTVILSFDGNAINSSQLNGPYTVTNLHLIDVESGISGQSADNVWTTPAYKWSDFGLGGPPLPGPGEDQIYLPNILK